jgi:hypothetical protein
MNKAEGSKQKKRGQSKFYALKRLKRTETEYDVKEETDNLLATCEKSFKLNHWNLFV